MASGVTENIENGTKTQKIVSDAIVDASVEFGIIAVSAGVGGFVGLWFGVPALGTAAGVAVADIVEQVIDGFVNADILGGKSLVDWLKEGTGGIADYAVEIAPSIATAAVAINATGGCFIGGGSAGSGSGFYSLSYLAMGAREYAFLFMN